MANEFKIKKGLIVTGASGGTVVDIQGSQGQLFSVTDDLSGSIFAVSDISGVPIFDVNSSGVSYFDGKVGIGDPNPVNNLSVVGSIATDDIFMTNTAASGAGTLFVVNEATQLVVRTAAQVLSDIGGAPATGGSYLPLAGGTMTGALTGTSATFSGLVFTKIYKTISANISNAYVRIAEIDETGGMLSSTVRVTMTAHGNAHVTTCNAIISVGHSQDILIESNNLAYTQVTLKVDSNSNGLWTLSVKSDSANATTYQFDIQGLSNNLTITPNPTASQTGTTLEHTTNFGTNVTATGGTMYNKFGGKLFISSVDANTTSVTALVLDGDEVEKRTLGTGAFGPTPVGAYLPLAGGTMANTNLVTNMNADLIDGYSSASLWRSDGGVWNPSSNITLGQSANSQEWSFDITRNGYTGGYWQVWDSSNSTMLKVDAVTGKVHAPYNFVGALEGNATTVTNGVYTTGNQTIAGNKIFTDTTTLKNAYQAYHQVATGDYYYDSYDGSKNLRWLVQGAKSDIIRYQSYSNTEYWNGTAWVAWSQTSMFNNILDGQKTTSSGGSITNTTKKFRFEVQANTGWPTTAIIWVETSWTGASWPGLNVTIEEWDTTTSSWSTNTGAAAAFTSANGVTNWGLMGHVVTSLHTGDSLTRITMDFGAMPTTGSYTTVPLLNVMITSNFSGLDNTVFPFTVNYNKDLTTTGGLYAAGGNSTEWNTAYDNRITSLTTTGTSGVATLVSNVLNIPNYADGQGVTSVGGTAPIVSSGGTTPDISITAATTVAAGSMSATDKAKLDGIAAGAQVNVGTNIAQGTRTTTTVPVTSSTGTDATLAAATTSLAGVMTSADKTKLDGIAAGANTGTVTSVTAGSGMTQTGTSTVNPTLNVIGGTGITANADDVAITYTGAGNAILAAVDGSGTTLFTGAKIWFSDDGTIAHANVSDLPFTNTAGTVTSVGGTGTVSGLTLTGTVTSSGNLTLGGTLALTSGNITTGLGFTPYNATNPAGYTTNTGTVTGTGTTNYVSKFTSASDIENSVIYDDGTNVGINTTTPQQLLQVLGTTEGYIMVQGASDSGKAGIYFKKEDTTGTMNRTKGLILFHYSALNIWGRGHLGFCLNSADSNAYATISDEKFRMVDNGDFLADGDVVAYSTTISDARYKTNIQPIESALDKVNKMRGVSFDWTAVRSGREFGVIAQEIEQIAPELVSEKELLNGDTMKTVSYTSLVPFLIESIKELTAKVEALETKINQQ